jgi:hypothetical protein
MVTETVIGTAKAGITRMAVGTTTGTTTGTTKKATIIGMARAIVRAIARAVHPTYGILTIGILHTGIPTTGTEVSERATPATEMVFVIASITAMVFVTAAITAEGRGARNLNPLINEVVRNSVSSTELLRTHIQMPQIVPEHDAFLYSEFDFNVN